MQLALVSQSRPRSEAVMTLKKNTEIAASKIQAGNIKKKKKEVKTASIDEKRRLEVLAQGGNPYAVKVLMALSLELHHSTSEQ